MENDLSEATRVFLAQGQIEKDYKEPDTYLKWAVARTQELPRAKIIETYQLKGQRKADIRLDPFDWKSFEFEVVAFVTHDLGLQEIDGKLDKPTEEQARLIFVLMASAIRDASLKKTIFLGQLTSEPTLHWSKERYHEREATSDWVTRAVRKLSSLIVERGHLIKACTAAKPRSEENCEKLVVAGRVDQLYCSATCASRMSTQSGRPKKRKRKIKAIPGYAFKFLKQRQKIVALLQTPKVVRRLPGKNTKDRIELVKSLLVRLNRDTLDKFWKDLENQDVDLKLVQSLKKKTMK